MLTEEENKTLKIASIITLLQELRAIYKPLYVLQRDAMLFAPPGDYGEIFRLKQKISKLIDEYSGTAEVWDLKELQHFLWFLKPWDYIGIVENIDKLIDYFIAEKYKQGDPFYRAD